MSEMRKFLCTQEKNGTSLSRMKEFFAIFLLLLLLLLTEAAGYFGHCLCCYAVVVGPFKSVVPVLPFSSLFGPDVQLTLKIGGGMEMRSRGRKNRDNFCLRLTNLKSRAPQKLISLFLHRTPFFVFILHLCLTRSLFTVLKKNSLHF